MTSKQTRQYFSGLDGLRAIAVVFVILFHLMPNIFSGGFIGVPMFFVISGLLITDSILVEISTTAKFNISRFYIKRLKRLFPALAVMIGLVATFLFIFYKDGLYGIRDVVWTNFTYTNNWWQIFNQTNYFELSNNWAPFTHLWSLSVEAQFYFIWPIVLTVLIFSTRKRAINALKLSVVLSIISMILFSILYTPANLNRSYYGTDTRFYAFLFGAIISIINRTDILNSNSNNRLFNQIKTWIFKSRGLIATVSLIILFVGFAVLDGQRDWTYLWGTHLVTFAAAVAVACVVFEQKGFFNRVLSNPVFRYLGKRSYSIYLYQLPVMVIMEHFLKNVISSKALLVVLELIAILFFSELSYRFVEITRYSNGNPFQNVINFFKYPTFKRVLKTSVATFVITILTVGTISAMTSKEATYSADSDQLEKELNQKQIETASSNKEAATNIRNDIEVTQEDIDTANANNIQPQSLAELRTHSYTAIGDSVMLDIAPSLQNILPSTVVDAKVGEQVYDGVASLESIEQSGQLGDVIIVVLGMNGSISKDQVKQIMNIAGDRDVYWVNNRAEGRSWIEPNNKLLSKQDKKYKNLHIVNWYKLSNDKPYMFAEDGTHPTQEGIDTLVVELMQTIEKYSVK